MANGGLGGLLPSGLTRTLVRTANRVPPIHRYLNRRLINRYANAIPPRPRALSMAAPGTTWRGLTDRRYSGRHLPPAKAFTDALPPLEEVVQLFVRTEDRRAADTSLLFPFFAQWFTDGFLRTKWKKPEEQDFAENESNHEIDLCQIYGVTEKQTAILRAFQGGRLRSQQINGEECPENLFEDTGRAQRIRPEFEDLHTPSISRACSTARATSTRGTCLRSASSTATRPSATR